MFDNKEEKKLTEEERNWAPIEIENKEILIFIAYSIFVYIFLILFLFYIPINFRTIWVLINIVIGYAILSNEKARKYYGNMFGGFKELKVWLYAILNLALIFGAIFLSSFLFPPSGGGSDGSSEGNPFVSNYLFLLAVIPIIPLFADAETKLFQAWIIKGMNLKHLVKCEKCGNKALPLEKCDICNSKLLMADAFELSQYMPAIFVSGLIFALAHVLLVGNFLPILLIIGGILLGILYVKEGAMVVAKVHMVYDYIVIAIILIGVSL